MKPKVYVETTVISYLTARPSRDVVVAGHQQTTREWWRTCHTRFELVASQLVLGEAAAGDPDVARERLEILGELSLLANAALRTKIENICRTAGYEPVVICTPEELLGD